MTEFRASLSSCFNNATLPLLIAVVFLAVTGCANTEDSAIDSAGASTGDPGGDPVDFDSEVFTFPDDLPTIRVTSPTFGDAERIPVKYTCNGDDVSPPLVWTGVPEAAGSIVIVCENLDSTGGAFAHWVCFTQDVSQVSLSEDAFGQPAVETVWTETVEYRGPCPPEGPPHRFLFHVIAVEGQLSLSEGASIEEQLPEMEGRVLARGAHTATFSRSSEPNPFAPADTSSPRSTLTTFIDSCNELQQVRMLTGHFDDDDPALRAIAKRILDCLDASELPEFARLDALAEAAICLKEVIDRVEIPLEGEIPGPGDLEDEDGNRLERWHLPASRIVIGHVKEGPQTNEYVFTPGTVSRARELYDEMAAMEYRDYGPEVSPGLYRWYRSAPGSSIGATVYRHLPEWTLTQVVDLALWQWFTLIVGLVVSVLLFVVAYRLQRLLARRYLETSLFGYFLTLLIPLVAVAIPYGFRTFAWEHVRVRGNPLYVITFATDLVTLLAVIIVIFSVSNRVTEVFLTSPTINPRGLDAQFIRIVGRLLALIASVIVFLEGGSYLGIPVTTLLASAGVGGIAVALALQDTIKNVFATITLMADKPFRVGERIVIKDYDGVVENIGLRSTRIRLLNGHQVTVPNDQLASSDIENIGRRPYIRRVADLHVPLDTPREKIEVAVEKIRAALDNHEGMQPEFPPRVFFNEFNPDSFNVRIMYWYHPPNYWDYLAFTEKLNHEVFRAFDEQGVQFSQPVRVTAETSGDAALAAGVMTDAPP